MKVKLLNQCSKLPTIAYQDDAGFDVYSPINVSFEPGEIKQVKLGIAIELVKDEVAMMSERSGQAINFGLTSIGNIIDAGYRGEISIILINLGHRYYEIKVGDKIGQIIVCKLGNREIVEVDKLSESSRDTKAHYSSGT